MDRSCLERAVAFVTSCLLLWLTYPFQKCSFSFFSWSKFFHLRADQVKREGQNENISIPINQTVERTVIICKEGQVLESKIQIGCKGMQVNKENKYSRTSMAQIPLEPSKYVRDWGSSS